MSTVTPSQSKTLNAFILTLLVALSWNEGMSAPLPRGLWGGEHIGLTVGKDGGRLEYDCARGTIDQPIRLDRKGRFSVTGRHTFEGGGPITKDEKSHRHRALYTGQIVGKKMVITVTLTDTKQPVGTFILFYEQRPDLFKCK